MPKKNKSKRNRSGRPGTADKALARDQCEHKLWKQKTARVPVLRDPYSLRATQMWLFVYANVNRAGFRLYYGSNSTGTLAPAAGNSSSWLWGDFTGQFAPNAALYKLYGVDRICAKFTPGTFAGFGHTLGTYSFIDPTGANVAQLIQGVNLPFDFFSGFSDAMSIKVHKPYDTVQESVDLTRLRYLEQDKSFLQTINATGVRDEWEAGQSVPTGSLETFLPGVVICMPLQIPNLADISLAALGLGTCEFTSHIRFQQRRTRSETVSLPRPFQDLLVDQTFPTYREALESEKEEELRGQSVDTGVPTGTTLSQSLMREVFDEVQGKLSKAQKHGFRPPTTGHAFSSDPAGDGPFQHQQRISSNCSAADSSCDEDG